MINEKEPTYGELLTRVAHLEKQLDLQRATGLLAGSHSRSADETLHAIQAILSAIVESTEDLIWAVDAEHFRLLMFNHGLRDYFSRERGLSIVQGQGIEDLFPTEEFVRRWRGYYGRALREGPYTTEYVVYDGTRTLELCFNLMRSDGPPFGISVFARDITERRSTEEALRKSEQKFRQITEESPVAIYIIQEGKLVYVNPSLARQAGYEREEMVGKLSPQDLIHRHDVARLMTTLGERAAGKIQGQAVEYRGVRKDGSIIHFEAYGLLMEYQGKPAVMGTLIDISERRRLEHALSGSESCLRVALAAANAGTWEWDLTTHEHLWSEQVWTLFGLHPDESPPSYEAWLRSVHPDDRESMAAAVQEAVSHGGELSVEWRVSTMDGSVRWLMSRGRAERDTSGKLARYIGIVVETTASKRRA